MHVFLFPKFCFSILMSESVLINSVKAIKYILVKIKDRSLILLHYRHRWR